LGMLMDSRVCPPTKIKITLGAFWELQKELGELVDELEHLEEVELYDILYYLKCSALYGLLKTVEGRLKSLDPNSNVNLTIRTDDALMLVEILSMKGDGYSTDLRIVRSLANQIILENPLLEKFGMKDFSMPTTKNDKVHVVQSVGSLIKNDFKV